MRSHSIEAGQVRRVGYGEPENQGVYPVCATERGGKERCYLIVRNLGSSFHVRVSGETFFTPPSPPLLWRVESNGFRVEVGGLPLIRVSEGQDDK